MIGFILLEQMAVPLEERLLDKYVWIKDTFLPLQVWLSQQFTPSNDQVRILISFQK